MQYAIRPNARDNTSMNRDIVIKTVGSVINRSNIVDLKGYELLILVETVKVSDFFDSSNLEYNWD